MWGVGDPSLTLSQFGQDTGVRGATHPDLCCQLPDASRIGSGLGTCPPPHPNPGPTCLALGMLLLLGKVSGGTHSAFAHSRHDSVSPLCSPLCERVLRFLPASSSPASGSLTALVSKGSSSPRKREQSRGQA